jgi:N-acetylneuraminic acid mutarotase
VCFLVKTAFQATTKSSSMKKQINPNVKAHLIRSSFYVLLLLAVCVIPFALGQRNVGKLRFPGARGQHRVARPQGTCPTPWNLVADMPLDLDYNAGASDGTYFYSISGYSFSVGNTVDAVYRYDTVANSWDTMASIPLAALGHVAVYYPTTNKIYVFGGEDVSGNNFNNTQIYDIATDTWTAGANMPDLGSFMAAGYVPSTGQIYLISGYNTGFIDSAQDRTWAYDPVADSWTDLTATVSFPHPAGGFAYGVINNKVYLSGGRDANNANINLTWEFDPSVPAYTPKADMPGFQPNQPGSAVALNALFAFGGGNPFLAAGSSAAKSASALSKATSGTTRVTSAGNKTAAGSNKIASDLTRTAFPIALGRAAAKDRALIPLTTDHTYVYDPSLDQWTTSADMNNNRSGPGGAFISGSNQIIAAGGFDASSGFDTATAEALTPCIPTPTPTPTPCPPTPTPTPPCGLLIGDGLTIGFAPNNYQLIASNIVNYTFSSSVSAPGDFAIFETHDPWGFTVVKDAITAAGHTYTVFTPADLAGFDFSQYRVVILNWDDTFLSEFGGSAACGGGGAYISALPALEAYSAAGGVVWVQGAIQGNFGDCYPLPFGGQSCVDFGSADPIVDRCSPMMLGVPDPIFGNNASHVSDTDLPAAAHVVVINDVDSNPVLYDLACATPQPTPTPPPPLGCDTGLITNGGFETGNLTTWVVDGTVPSPVVTNALSHSGRFSAFAGGNPPALQFCGFGASPSGDSSFYQQFGPVPANATLSFWHWDCNTSFDIAFAWQDAYITDTDGNILQTIYHQMLNCESWVNQRVDLTPWVGQTIGVKFLVHEDGFGDLTSMLVDDVGLFVPGPCASPTPRPTPSPRQPPSPHPRP